MQIKINFTNQNDSADGVRVYRSPTFIDVNALPAPLATLAGNASTFTDDTVVKGQSYYYVFEIYKGADKAVSSNIQATAAQYSGPGPQTLKAGDLSAGYYGIVSSVDLMTWDALLAWSGVTYTSKNPVVVQDWLKFAYKGKTLFIPRQAIAFTTWNNLYNAGLVFGVNGPGPREYNTATSPVNQQRIISSAGQSFKVRLMTSVPASFDLTQTIGAASNVAAMNAYPTGASMSDSLDCVPDLSGSEWNDLFYRIMSWSPPSQRGRNWDTLDVSLATGSMATYAGLSADSLFQEMLSGKTVITRGKLASVNTYQPGYIWTLAATVSAQWRPVLELI